MLFSVRTVFAGLAAVIAVCGLGCSDAVARDRSRAPQDIVIELAPLAPIRPEETPPERHEPPADPAPAQPADAALSPIRPLPTPQKAPGPKSAEVKETPPQEKPVVAGTAGTPEPASQDLAAKFAETNREETYFPFGDVDLPALALLRDAPKSRAMLRPEPAALDGLPTIDMAKLKWPGDDFAEIDALKDPAERLRRLIAKGVVGPAVVRLGDHASFSVPAERVFLPLPLARRVAREVGLELRPATIGLVTPTDENRRWFAQVEQIDEGHIEIGGKDALDPEKILANMREGLAEENIRRVANGLHLARIDGWLKPPRADDKQRVSACTNVSAGAKESGDRFFNCQSWALGREGGFKIGVADGAEKGKDLKEVSESLAKGVVFDEGMTYGDYNPASDRRAGLEFSRMFMAKAIKNAAQAGGVPQKDESLDIAGILFGLYDAYLARFFKDGNIFVIGGVALGAAIVFALLLMIIAAMIGAFRKRLAGDGEDEGPEFVTTSPALFEGLQIWFEKFKEARAAKKDGSSSPLKRLAKRFRRKKADKETEEAQPVDLSRVKAAPGKAAAASEPTTKEPTTEAPSSDVIDPNDKNGVSAAIQARRALKDKQNP